MTFFAWLFFKHIIVQVAINDLIMLVLFAQIVMLLFGVLNIVVPKDVLFFSVFFI